MFFKNLYGKDIPQGDHHIDPSKIQEWNDFTYHNKTVTNTDHSQLNEEINFAELDAAIHKLKNNKSSAEDLITNEMLKNLTIKARQCIQKLFNICLESGIYPWDTSVITPLLKSGNANDPDNYRPIAVSSCLGKLFSTILLDRLICFRREFCPDSPNQLGFCKGSQTNDHVFTLKTIIDKYIKTQKRGKNKVYSCFVDLKKAFDTVCRSALLYKLVNLNVRGSFFNVLENMYNNSHAKIKISGKLSEALDILSGTEQGHPMSPELFKIFLYDLSDELDVCENAPQLYDMLSLIHI